MLGQSGASRHMRMEVVMQVEESSKSAGIKSFGPGSDTAAPGGEQASERASEQTSEQAVEEESQPTSAGVVPG